MYQLVCVFGVVLNFFCSKVQVFHPYVSGYTFGIMASILFRGHYNHITQCKKPKLFILGDADGFTSVKQLESYVTSCKGSCNLKKIVTGGIGHFELETPIYDQKICNWIHNFIQQHILPLQAATSPPISPQSIQKGVANTKTEQEKTKNNE